MKQGIKLQNIQPSPSQRKKIWNIEPSYICSVIGTCFRRSELRQLARKKKFGLDPGSSDFSLHSTLVSQIGNLTHNSSMLNKILDNKNRTTINRYAQAKDDHAIMSLWAEDLQRGNVPGAYWAIMTHPAASESLIRDIYGTVHMMSHDTHGDYQRDNTTITNLKEKVILLEEVLGSERQQHLKDKKALKKEVSDLSEIEQLYIALKGDDTRLQVTFNQGSSQVPDNFRQQHDELRQHIAYLCGRLDELSDELELKDEMLELACITVDNLEKTQGRIYSQKEEMRREVISLEAALLINFSTSRNCKTCEDQDTNRCPGPDLCGKTVLYVGGRQSLVPMYRRLIERHGGNFLHHDGVKEVPGARLPEMLTGADIVVCPVDCVSHDACTSVKKICKRYLKPYVMMRSSGLSSLSKGLTEITQ